MICSNGVLCTVSFSHKGSFDVVIDFGFDKEIIVLCFSVMISNARRFDLIEFPNSSVFDDYLFLY